MAAAPNNKKQVMDVARPGKTVPNATARPVIVGHSGMIKDPMVQADNSSVPAEGAAKDNASPAVMPVKPRVAKLVQPLSAQNPEPSQGPNSDDSSKAEETVSESDVSAQQSVEPTESKPTETDPALSGSTGSTATPREDEGGSKEEAEKQEETNEASVEETDSAAVVDAVVDQAAAGKKQKEEDKEALARKEAVKRLVEEKKYFVPIKQPVRTRTGHLLAAMIAVLIVFLGGGYVAADAGLVKLPFELPVHFFSQEAASTDTADTTRPATANQPTGPSGSPAIDPGGASYPTALYTSRDYGVVFLYPKDWGDVTAVKVNGPISGNRVTFSFSKQSLLKAGMVSKDYKEQGKDGMCADASGVPPGVSLAAIKGTISEGDGNNSASYKSTARVLKNTADTFVYERFEAGMSDALGACPGLSAVGFRTFPATVTYTGIQFSWGGDTASRKAVPVSEFDKYKANPNAYLADTDRQALVTTINSVRNL